MKTDFTNYYKRDFFEFSAVLEFFKCVEKGEKFHTNEFCVKWDKNYNETAFYRASIERVLGGISLEKYLLDKVGIFRLNFENMSSMSYTDLKNIHLYANIMIYLIENDYRREQPLRLDKELVSIGYSYSEFQRRKVKIKIKNLYESDQAYENIRKELVEFRDCIEFIKAKAMKELERRATPKKNSKLNDIKVNLSEIKSPSDKTEIKVEKVNDKKLEEKLQEQSQNEQVQEVKDLNKIEGNEKDKSEETVQIANETPKQEVKIKSQDITSENEKLKLLFDEFYSKVNKLFPKEEQPQDEKNFDRLKEEYQLLMKEKLDLQERIKSLENEIKEVNDRYIELQNTIKSRESESDFNAVKNIYKILNDKDDLFLDKIYKAKEENKNLDPKDFQRITNNIISNLESFGIRVSPFGKKIDEKIDVTEADISEYRMDAKTVDTILDKGSLEVKVKYPSWIYINKEFKTQMRKLDSEMVE